MISLLVAEDHAIVRQGLVALLNAEADLHVVGEAVDGVDAVEQVARLRPAVLLLDLAMPRLHGLEALVQALQRSPATRVLVLSMHAEVAFVVGALQRGAAGFVTKQDSIGHLAEGVRAVMGGQRYLSPSLPHEGIARALAG